MDDRTKRVLKVIDLHSRVKSFLTILSYLLIIGGLLFYVFHAVSKTQSTFKIVNDYKDNPKKYNTTKKMTNPRMDFQYNDNEVYHIKAKEAYHENEEEVTMYDVVATGSIGNITAGELQISEEGDHLIFSDHPVLILNKTENINE